MGTPGIPGTPGTAGRHARSPAEAVGDHGTVGRPAQQPVAASPPVTPDTAGTAAGAVVGGGVRPAPTVPPTRAPTPPPTARILDEPRSGPVRNAFIGGAALFGLFLSGLASDLLASILSGGAYPSWVERALNVLGFAILVVLVVVWLVGRHLERRRARDGRLDDDLVAPGPPLRPAWFRTPVTLHGRDTEVARALGLVRKHGLVAVTGSSGMGSSAVAEAVVHQLIADGHTDAAHAAPFDLRGWSNESPDDPATIAGRLLSMFGAAEPVSADPEVLAHAGRRLGRLLSAPAAVLLLDNLSTPEQVAWLVDQWPTNSNRPALVVAGRPAIGSAFPAECVVALGGLETSDLRLTWQDELERGTPASLPSAERLDEVLAACAGRPGAVRDLAREVARPDSPADADKLAALLHAEPHADPREGVWLAILRRTHYGLSRKARRLAGALAELPVAELTVEAMEAVRHGVDEADGADVEVDDAAPTTPTPDVVDAIQELSHRYLLRQSAVGRYRMPSEVRHAVRAIEPEAERRSAVRAALPSLVNRYADLAERWGALLDVTEHAGSAARWFQAEEPLLRALLVADYTDERTSSYPEGELLALTVDGLARLADALDRWYALQQQRAGAELVHTHMIGLANDAGRPELAALSATRMASVLRGAGHIDDAEAMLFRAGSHHPPLLRGNRTGSALWARHHHERAWLHVSRAERAVDDLNVAAGELAAAERALQRAWVRLPRHDVQGEVTTLLSMAVVYLRQGLPERALDRLDLAETRAQDGDDPGGQAHAAELRGIAAWMQGRAPVAAAWWQRALTWFGELADRQGEARCLAHLGSAVLVAPELAGLLVEDTRRPVDEVTAVRNAEAWLERSQRLRAGQPPVAVAEEYLRLARSRAMRTSAPFPRPSSTRVSASSGAETVETEDADDDVLELDTDDLPARSRPEGNVRGAPGVLRRALTRIGRRLLS